MKRTPLKPFKRKEGVQYHFGTTIRVKSDSKPIKYQSDKRRKADKQNHDITIKKCGGICQICKINPATDHHHLIPRSWVLSGGYENRDNADYFIGVCRACHNKIHLSRDNIIATAKKFGVFME